MAEANYEQAIAFIAATSGIEMGDFRRIVSEDNIITFDLNDDVKLDSLIRKTSRRLQHKAAMQRTVTGETYIWDFYTQRRIKLTKNKNTKAIQLSLIQVEEVDLTEKPVGKCQYFRNCYNAATVYVAHPVLKRVACCDKCNAWLKRMDGQRPS